MTVKGTGFPATELVGLFFDTEDLVVAVTNVTGPFSQILKMNSERIPRSLLRG